jgi:hypothetical protein
MPLNETVYRDCPSCGGKKKFSVTRTAHGVLWNCFKLSCREKGSDIVSGELLPPNKKRTKLKPYTRDFLPLGIEDRQYFEERFDHFPHDVRKTDDGRYLLPVYTPNQYVRGWVVREPWDDWAPVSGTGRLPKAVLYMHAAGPTQSWYHILSGPRKVVLVEDQMSGYAVQQAGVSACALMGTQLDNDKIREIAQQKPDEVIIALDADATDQAFKLARKWGLAFRKTRVAILQRDLKDEQLSEIPHILGLQL